jgi:hypothetical protein
MYRNEKFSAEMVFCKIDPWSKKASEPKFGATAVSFTSVLSRVFSTKQSRVTHVTIFAAWASIR